LPYKIAITGHTSGLGKALAEYCDNKGIEWVGFSRSNGKDISNKEFYKRLPIAIADCDVFINNAYMQHNQIALLYDVWELWQQLDKHIICISSTSQEYLHKNQVYSYDAYKQGLDYGCAQLQYINGSRCKVTNIKPGWIDTPMVTNYHERHPYLPKPDHMMDPNYVAKVIMWTLDQPEHIESLTITAGRNADCK
jgi:NADP-dependent 3-hydroxy acid dehydrogenase YdfG